MNARNPVENGEPRLIAVTLLVLLMFGLATNSLLLELALLLCFFVVAFHLSLRWHRPNPSGRAVPPIEARRMRERRS